jgi:hypothetical protein
MKLVMAMISRQLFYLSGPMSVALNKTICLFIEQHSNIRLKFQSSNFDNLKKFLFKVATTIMNGHQRFLPGKL